MRDGNGPGAHRVADAVDLVNELDLLRRRAARGSGKAKVGLDELARRLAMPRSTVHTYVSGRTLPPADVLDHMVIALGASQAEQREWAEAWFRASAGPSQAAAEPVPAQLPAGVPEFTGRETELRRLDALLNHRDDTAVVSTIDGMAGIGKTALVVHWAHRVRHRFPDGQLFADLRGYAPVNPEPPGEVVLRLLHGLGVPADRVPDDLDAASALLRTRLDGRRVLVVLDNARDPGQVRPLLPGGSACVVLVTSRSRLRGLAVRDGAQRITVDRLSPAESRALLDRLLGAGEIAAAPAAADEIMGRCEGLPLALSIVGHCSARDTSLTRLALAMRDRESLVAALTDDEDPWSNLWTVFSWSYRALPADAAHLFRALGGHRGGSVTARAAAALARVPVKEARRLLRLLADRHVVERCGSGEYALHELARAYADDVAPPPPCRRPPV